VGRSYVIESMMEEIRQLGRTISISIPRALRELLEYAHSAIYGTAHGQFWSWIMQGTLALASTEDRVIVRP